MLSLFESMGSLTACFLHDPLHTRSEAGLWNHPLTLIGVFQILDAHDAAEHAQQSAEQEHDRQQRERCVDALGQHELHAQQGDEAEQEQNAEENLHNSPKIAPIQYKRNLSLSERGRERRDPGLFKYKYSGKWADCQQKRTRGL